METDNEKFITDLISTLPRKEITSGDKVRVWQTVSAHMRLARVQKTDKAHFGGVFIIFRRKLGKVLVTMVMVLIAITLVTGAANAQPGETLYPVKKAAEKVERALATSEEAKTKVGIKHAKRRIEEVKVLVQENKENKIVSKTIEGLTDATKGINESIASAATSQPELVNEALALTEAETQILVSVEGKVDAGVKEAAEQIIVSTKETVDKIISEAGNVEGTATSTIPVITSEQATSTLGETAKPAEKAVQIEDQDGTIESQIQIDGFVDTEEKPAENSEPTILPQPTQ